MKPNPICMYGGHFHEQKQFVLKPCSLIPSLLEVGYIAIEVSRSLPVLSSKI